MKVLLIQPRRPCARGFGLHTVVEPLGLEMVAAALCEHQVEILDLFPDERLATRVATFRPDACGISCSFTTDVYQTLETAAAVKTARPSCFVFVGGHHATLNPIDFCRGAVDAVVLGEGETTTPALLQALHAGSDLRAVPGLMLTAPGPPHCTGLRPLVDHPDKLPVPARDLTKAYRHRYHLGLSPVTTVETARGCPYRCHFCSVWRFYRKRCRWKSPERVVAELTGLPETPILFTDDNFLASPPRAARIAQLIRACRLRRPFVFQARSDSIVRFPEVVARWRAAGLTSVFIGFEKIEDEALAGVGKANSVANNERALDILRAHHVKVTASFIVDPEATVGDFSRLRAYLRRHRILQPTFSILTPLPGTDLFEALRERLMTTNYELFDFLHAVLPTRLVLPEFYQEFARLYRWAYLGQLANWRSTVMAILSCLVRGRLSVRRLVDSLRTGLQLFDARGYLADHAT